MQTDPRDVDALVERLEHCSKNTRDEYLHELTGRAATTITALQAEVAALREALRCSPIPALREEMMAFRDRQDKWLRDTYAPVMARAALGQQP